LDDNGFIGKQYERKGIVMNILIIGYGSIGKRHEEVLTSINKNFNIHIVTKQDIKDKVTYKNLQDIKDVSVYDYFIIASETYKHFEQLKFLNSRVRNKIIFCEKPLFERYKAFESINNSIVVGYVLRFHPLLLKLRELLKNDIIIMASIKCGQYLPDWRKDVDYRDSYSAKKEEGGGVLLDLSHEIDYCQWLFGKAVEIKSYQVKISDLEINSDDLAIFIGKTEQGVIINLSVDYISKITHRRMIVETLNNSYDLDFITNTLKRSDKLGNIQIINAKSFDRNDMFIKMHSSILSNEQMACSFKELMNAFL